MINLGTLLDGDGGVSRDPAYAVGMLVRHRRYHYRGVIVSLDHKFSGSDDWYAKNQTQPVKSQAWYHVLVDNSTSVTYAAQTSLERDASGLAVTHPLVHVFFSGRDGQGYIRNDKPW